MRKFRILVVDDDEDLSMIIMDMFEDYGYEAGHANDAKEAYAMLGESKYDLIILDINLSGENGFEILKEIRKISSIPVIFASARTNEEDRITGFDMGGDDYIPKPYSLKELLVRVNAALRRAYGTTQEEVIKVGNIAINPSARSVTRDGMIVSLSLKEFDVLLYLANHKNSVVKKETLLSEVWGIYSDVEASTVSVHIRWLREKLETDPAKPILIKTVWGVGYSLEG